MAGIGDWAEYSNTDIRRATQRLFRCFNLRDDRSQLGRTSYHTLKSLFY